MIAPAAPETTRTSTRPSASSDAAGTSQEAAAALSHSTGVSAVTAPSRSANRHLPSRPRRKSEPWMVRLPPEGGSRRGVMLATRGAATERSSAALSSTTMPFAAMASWKGPGASPSGTTQDKDPGLSGAAAATVRSGEDDACVKKHAKSSRESRFTPVKVTALPGAKAVELETMGAMDGAATNERGTAFEASARVSQLEERATWKASPPPPGPAVPS